MVIKSISSCFVVDYLLFTIAIYQSYSSCHWSLTIGIISNKFFLWHGNSSITFKFWINANYFLLITVTQNVRGFKWYLELKIIHSYCDVMRQNCRTTFKKYLTSLKYFSYGVEHLIGLAPKLSKMSRTYSYLFGTSFYGENKLHYFIYQKCSDLNCTILESNLGNVLLTNSDSFSQEALKQGPCTCSTFKSFLVISANVPCTY